MHRQVGFWRHTICLIEREINLGLKLYFRVIQTDLACSLPNLSESLQKLLKINIEDELT